MNGLTTKETNQTTSCLCGCCEGCDLVTDDYDAGTTSSSLATATTSTTGGVSPINTSRKRTASTSSSPTNSSCSTSYISVGSTTASCIMCGDTSYRNRRSCTTCSSLTCYCVCSNTSCSTPTTATGRIWSANSTIKTLRWCWC